MDIKRGYICNEGRSNARWSHLSMLNREAELGNRWYQSNEDKISSPWIAKWDYQEVGGKVKMQRGGVLGALVVVKIH